MGRYYDFASAIRLRVFLLDFLSDGGRNRLVVVELHGVLGAALRHRTQRIDVFEHVRKWNHRIDDNRNAACFLTLDLTTATVDVTNDVAHVVFRRHNLDLHDRLEELCTSLLSAFTESRTRCDLERQHRG